MVYNYQICFDGRPTTGMPLGAEQDPIEVQRILENLPNHIEHHMDDGVRVLISKFYKWSVVVEITSQSVQGKINDQLEEALMAVPGLKLCGK